MSVPIGSAACVVTQLQLSDLNYFALTLLVVQDLQESSGVGGQQHILPVQNVSKESMISPEAGILLCKALQGALYAAMDYLENDADTSGAQTRSTYMPEEVSKA